MVSGIVHTEASVRVTANECFVSGCRFPDGSALLPQSGLAAHALRDVAVVVVHHAAKDLLALPRTKCLRLQYFSALRRGKRCCYYHQFCALRWPDPYAPSIKPYIVSLDRRDGYIVTISAPHDIVMRSRDFVYIVSEVQPQMANAGVSFVCLVGLF
jgi:hypothetical protein